jgi:hypothetical protein
MRKILRTMAVFILALALPMSASAGPIRSAAEKAARDLAQAPQTEVPGRGRFWTGVALVAGGTTLALLGGFEVGDDESGPDDGEDADDSDDGEDSDGFHKALLGGGIAAAALGGVLMWKGRDPGVRVSVRPGRVAVRHTFTF